MLLVGFCSLELRGRVLQLGIRSRSLIRTSAAPSGGSSRACTVSPRYGAVLLRVLRVRVRVRVCVHWLFSILLTPDQHQRVFVACSICLFVILAT